MQGAAADLVLEINNIEVVYNKVVQVLRGLSMAVPRGTAAIRVVNRERCRRA